MIEAHASMLSFVCTVCTSVPTSWPTQLITQIVHRFCPAISCCTETWNERAPANDCATYALLPHSHSPTTFYFHLYSI